MKRIRILLICSAGMSTSLLVNKIIQAGKKIQINVECEAVSTDRGKEIANNWDVVMIGPQVRYLLPYFKDNVDTPTAVIEPMHYALAKGEPVLKAALELAKTKKQ